MSFTSIYPSELVCYWSVVGWAVVVCGLVPVMAVHAIYEQPGRNYSRVCYGRN